MATVDPGKPLDSADWEVAEADNRPFTNENAFKLLPLPQVYTFPFQ